MNRIGRYARRGPAIAGLATTLVAMALLVATQPAAAQDAIPAVTPPQPTVPEMFTIQGQFVRVAYNNEGFVTLGYRSAQSEIGREWMLIQVGLTLRKPTPDFTLKRDAISMRTPDGKVIPLATQAEYAKASTGALNKRARNVHDSINYFPNDVTRPCPFSFFVDLETPRGVSVADEVSLSWQQACIGRLYFRVPGGIQVGQHWLDVKFAGSTVQVPFRILTKAEEKEFSKKWEDMKEKHDATTGQK